MRVFARYFFCIIKFRGINFPDELRRDVDSRVRARAIRIVLTTLVSCAIIINHSDGRTHVFARDYAREFLLAR